MARRSLPRLAVLSLLLALALLCLSPVAAQEPGAVTPVGAGATANDSSVTPPADPPAATVPGVVENPPSTTPASTTPVAEGPVPAAPPAAAEEGRSGGSSSPQSEETVEVDTTEDSNDDDETLTSEQAAEATATRDAAAQQEQAALGDKDGSQQQQQQQPNTPPAGDQTGEQPSSPIVDSSDGCPRNCSGHGECFLPKNALKSVCICDAGWEDSDCSLPSQSVDNSLPSFWLVLAVVGGVLAVERTYWAINKYCCKREASRSTAGFSQIQVDEFEEEFEDESLNDRL